MADYQEESESSDDIEGDWGSPSDQGNDLWVLDRLYQFSESQDNFSRQLVGRSVVETLRLVHESQADVEKVMDIIEKTAKDCEPAVRGEMMEHLPHIVMVCHELGLPSLTAIIDRLVPIVVDTIIDSDNKVRKTAQTSLLVLMEQNLISHKYIEEQLCPFIVSLTYFVTCTDFHPSIVALMSKMAPLLGNDITEQLFVPRLTALCSNCDIAIRKACASNFGDFCAVVSRHVTETQLLPKFCELARDIDWGVRKACAEVIMSVSCACCLETRKLVLAPVFASLLADVRRWVRIPAFQTLGPFITTFAKPSITSLAYNQQGELVLTNPEGFEFRFQGHKSNSLDALFEELALKKEAQSSIENSSGDPTIEDDQFNSFLYWREPLPDIDADICTTLASQEEGGPSSNCCNSLTKDNSLETSSVPEAPLNSLETSSVPEAPLNSCSKQLKNFGESCLSEKSRAARRNLSKCSIYENYESKYIGKRFQITHDGERPSLPTNPEPQQDIVPQSLIDHFVSMSDPCNASWTDTDIAHHCAFSLPAVALTLGPAHWDLLRDTYATLASDRQWKVRRTVASSIHELAVIVGEDVATQDLVPIFSGLIKDLDEVRIGALRHLAYFLRLLRPAGRNQFLPRLADFLKTEYDYNWRFREELASQLQQALCLFSPTDTCAHLTPVAISLLLDHVAAVRQTALFLVTELVAHVSADVSLLRGLLAELAEQFAHSARWNRRQTFARLCSQLVTERVLSDDLFARDVLPHLLDLSWDPVPNVRLTVARTLSVDIMDNQYFCNDQNPHYEVLIQALKRLQGDRDRDVRYYASLSPESCGRSTTTGNCDTWQMQRPHQECDYESSQRADNMGLRRLL